MSIRKQMILYFSCVMVVIFTLTELINGWQAYRQLEKNMTASVKELLNLSVKNMDYYFQDTSNVCSSIMADERTQNILQQEIGDDLNGKILGRELNKWSHSMLQPGLISRKSTLWIKIRRSLPRSSEENR